MFNFRDLGGTVTRTGKEVRSGRFYRSDSLANLGASAVDSATFVALGIRTVVDLRRAAEVAESGRVDLPGLRYVNIAPRHALWEPEPYDRAAGPARYLADRYLDMARDGRAGFAAVLAVVAEAGNAPVVVHCLAGKDRTGVLVALALSLLDVADDLIADEYAISDAFAAQAPPHLPAHWVGAPREAMLMFLADFRARHGSAVQYLLDGGLSERDVHRLRAHLLADRHATSGPPAVGQEQNASTVRVTAQEQAVSKE